MPVTTLLRRTRAPRSAAARGALGAVALAVVGTVLAPGPAVAAPSGTGAPQPRCVRELDRAVQRYVETTQRRDVKDYEKLLAPGYTIILPGGTVLAGRTASEGFIERFFARTDWTQTFQQTSQAVDGCRTGLVVLDSVYTDEDGPAPLVVALTWTHRGGRWLLLTDQNTVKDS